VRRLLRDYRVAAAGTPAVAIRTLTGCLRPRNSSMRDDVAMTGTDVQRSHVRNEDRSTRESEDFLSRSLPRVYHMVPPHCRRR